MDVNRQTLQWPSTHRFVKRKWIIANSNGSHGLEQPSWIILVNDLFQWLMMVMNHHQQAQWTVINHLWTIIVNSTWLANWLETAPKTHHGKTLGYSEGWTIADMAVITDYDPNPSVAMWAPAMEVPFCLSIILLGGQVACDQRYNKPTNLSGLGLPPFIPGNPSAHCHLRTFLVPYFGLG